MKNRNGLPNNLNQQSGKQRGYSLVETMVAIIIAAMGITGLSTAVTNASRLGNSAGQSGMITMALRSTFSQLRTALSVDASSTTAYRFRSDDSGTPPAASPLSVALQHQVDQLTNSMGDTRLTVNCEHMPVAACEVCFDWFDNASTTRALTDSTASQGATNRSNCQIQIV